MTKKVVTKRPTVEYEFLNRRSDPDAIVAIQPGGRRLTRLEDLTELGDKFCIIRTDIVLLNTSTPCTCNCCDHKGTISKQYSVEAYEDGQPRGDGWDLLSEEGRRWAIEENRRLLEIAAKYPVFKRYLYKAY